jgi:transcriptional antiterminator RfaH
MTVIPNPTPPTSPETHWYVIACQPSKEAGVAAALPARLGHLTYLPVIKEIVQGRPRMGPLFPGYVFVWAELHARAVSGIQAIMGVRRVLAYGGTPQTVEPAVIAHIREQVDRLNAAGGLSEPPFSNGERVRVASGPMYGLEAVFVGRRSARERVLILIDFLGQQRTAEVPLSALAKAQPEAAHARERRTRGHGRPIHGKRE